MVFPMKDLKLILLLNICWEIIGQLRLIFSSSTQLKYLFGTSDEYSDLTASLLALFFKEEFRDYYYSSGFNFNIESEVFPVLDLSVGYLTHNDKNAYTNTQFSFFNKDEEYPENPAIYETNVNAITAGFKLDFRDYIEDGYFRRRTSMGDSYTIFSGDVTYSNQDLLNSDLNYTTYGYILIILHEVFRSTFFNLDLFGMYNVGTLPYQDMYASSGKSKMVSKTIQLQDS